MTPPETTDSGNGSPSGSVQAPRIARDFVIGALRRIESTATATAS